MKHILANTSTLSLAVLAILTVAPSVDAQTSDNTSAPVQANDGTPGNPHPPIELNPFTVSSDQDLGYRKMSSVTTSRIGANIMTVPQSIEIISSELMQDLSIQDFTQTFRYTSSVLTDENESRQTNLMVLRGFEAPLYYNGVQLAATSSTLANPPWLPTDNIDRVEIAKGPVGLFYGNSTPNGIVNYISKRPEFANTSSLDLTIGSYRLAKAVFDTQSTLNKSIALRVIASTGTQDARVENLHKDYVFTADSVRIKPSDKVEVNAEFDYDKSHNPYFVDGPIVNPEYFSDLGNPSPQAIAYMESHYGAANDAAARALIQQRWDPPNATLSTATNNWSNDMLAITGKYTPASSGDTVQWWRYSPDGNRANFSSPESNFNSTTATATASITVTPVSDVSVKYNWLHQFQDEGFVRDVYTPNDDFLPDGRIQTLNATSITIRDETASYDTQQLDADFTKDFLNVKNQLIAGVEWNRSVATRLAGVVALTNAPSRVGTNGQPLVGAQVYQYYDPFTQPPPPVSVAQAGPLSVANPGGYIQTDIQKSEYVSYRASAFNGKLNTLAGVRSNSDTTLDRKGDTYTLGAIGEVLPGLSVFASKSTSLILVNQLSITGPGVRPGEAHQLGNEAGSGYELGFKSDWHDNTISGTVSYFEDQQSGIVEADYESQLTDPRNNTNDPNTYVRPFVNGGVDRVKGIDGSFIWTPRKQIQIVGNFQYIMQAAVVSDPSQAIGSLQYIREFDYPLAKSPKYHATLVAKYSFLRGALKNLSVGAGARYVDIYYLENSGLTYVPTETLIDLFGTYHITWQKKPIDVSLNVINALNTVNDITDGNGLEFRLSVRLGL